MNKPLNIVSLFDGMACGMLAMLKAGGANRQLLRIRN